MRDSIFLFLHIKYFIVTYEYCTDNDNFNDDYDNDNNKHNDNNDKKYRRIITPIRPKALACILVDLLSAKKGPNAAFLVQLTKFGTLIP